MGTLPGYCAKSFQNGIIVTSLHLVYYTLKENRATFATYLISWLVSLNSPRYWVDLRTALKCHLLREVKTITGTQFRGKFRGSYHEIRSDTMLVVLP